MQLEYRLDRMPTTEDIVLVYESSGIDRPTTDQQRIEEMYQNSNLIATAWDGNELVGVARSLTDFCFCCYLSDLAVSKEYQSKGIGKKLIRITKERLGERVTLILLAAPSAVEYYPKIGMERIEHGYLIHREA